MQTRIFPGFEHLFQLKDPVAKKVFRGQLSATVDALTLTRGESAAEEPVIVNWAMGSGSPSDVVWTTSAHLIIVHFRVIDILQKVNWTGWQRVAFWVRLRVSYEPMLEEQKQTWHRPRESSGPFLMTPEQCAQFLGIKINTLYVMKSQGRIL